MSKLNRRFFSIFLVVVFTSSTVFANPVRCENSFKNTKKSAWYTEISVQSVFKAVFNRTVNADDILPLDIYDPPEDEIVVGILGDRTITQRYTPAVSDYLTGAYSNNPNVYSGFPRNPNAMIDYLLSVYEKRGPINKLVILGHGAPGVTQIGNRSMNRWWSFMNSKRLESLPVDLFAPGAQVIILACSVGAGYNIYPNYGVNGFRRIFSKILKQGGQVILPRVALMAQIDRFTEHDPDALSANTYDKGLVDFHSMGLAKVLLIASALLPVAAAMLLMEGMNNFYRDIPTILGRKISVLEIPPRVSSD